MSSLSSSFWIVTSLLAGGLVHFLLFRESSPSIMQPYYAPDDSNPMFVASVFYTQVIHLSGIKYWSTLASQPKELPPPNPSFNTNKIAVVTGANTGIGFETAKTLVVDYGWQVLLACRSKEKALAAQDRIRKYQETQSPPGDVGGGDAIVLDQPLDLTDFESVDAYTKEIQAKYSSIDVLVNNAGLNTNSQSGIFNSLFQANFLGHFLLTHRLLSSLQEGGGRVVNLSSVMHHFSSSPDKELQSLPLNDEYWRTMALYSEDSTGVYAATKTAAILFSLELNRRYNTSNESSPQKAIESLSVNPGAAITDIWRAMGSGFRKVIELIFLNAEQASRPVVAACLPDTKVPPPIQHSDPDNSDYSPFYLQPYWQANYKKVPYPVTELMGPYIGYHATQPRLPSDGGQQAGASLWKVCSELAGIENYGEREDHVPGGEEDDA